MADEVIPDRSPPADETGVSVSTISRKIAAVFLVILAVAAANIVVVRNMLDDINGLAETVNVAGRLRMLSQKIAFHATKSLQYPDADSNAIATSLDDFDTALSALSHGGNAFGYRIRPLEQPH